MPSSATTALSRRPLKKVLEGVTDPRDRRGVRHPLTAILSLAVTGILAGCRSLTAIWEHAADLEPADLGALGPGEGRALPSESTIRRVLKDLDPAGLDARLTSWLCTRTGAIAGRRVIAVEDETMRGARTGDNPAPTSWRPRAGRAEWSWDSAECRMSPTRSPPCPTCSSRWTWTGP